MSRKDRPSRSEAMDAPRPERTSTARPQVANGGFRVLGLVRWSTREHARADAHRVAQARDPSGAGGSTGTLPVAPESRGCGDAAPPRRLVAATAHATGWQLLAAFACTHLVFAVWPVIDLRASALFFDGAGFPLARSEALHLLRHAIWAGAVVVALGSLAAWVAWIALGSRARVAPRALAYPAALAVLGPGLLVNGLLKEHWGRARPADIREFGGADPFTPPFQMAGPCSGNCSFVSGEGAGAVALALGLGALTTSGRARMGLAAAAVLASALRVATGRHYLSDVVFGAFLMVFAALLLHRAMRIGPARRTLTRENLVHDLGLLAAPLRRR